MHSGEKAFGYKELDLVVLSANFEEKDESGDWSGLINSIKTFMEEQFTEMQ